MAEIDGRTYERVIDGEFRWSEWTHKGLTGDKLITFVTGELLPHLRELGGTPQAEKVAAIFSGVRTVMKSGYSLAEVVALVDTIDFEAPRATTP